MKHPTSRLLFAYWDALRRDRAAPDSREIDPDRIRHILADTFILSADDPAEPEFRVAGSRCAALFGGDDLAGIGFGDLWGHDRREAGRLVGTVLSDTVGIVVGSLAAGPDGHAVPLETVLLPLRHRGRPHTRVLGAVSPRSLADPARVVPLRHHALTSLRVIHGGTRRVVDGPGRAGRPSPLVVHQGGRTGGHADHAP